jgi:hypothetical protein
VALGVITSLALEVVAVEAQVEAEQVTDLRGATAVLLLKLVAAVVVVRAVPGVLALPQT